MCEHVVAQVLMYIQWSRKMKILGGQNTRSAMRCKEAIMDD